MMNVPTQSGAEIEEENVNSGYTLSRRKAGLYQNAIPDMASHARHT